MTSSLRALRDYCRACMPEPRGAYLRCQTWECPAWRFRCGNPNIYGSASGRHSHFTTTGLTTSGQNSPSWEAARLLILKRESEGKSGGKTQSPATKHWPYGELGHVSGERPLKAVRRICGECMGGVREIGGCPSVGCELYVWRMGRRAKG
jgi:hypothetical protein